MNSESKMERDWLNLGTVLFFGSLWGLAEATLGFGLHLLPRITGVPPLAGLVLFPVGVCFMLAGVTRTGRPATAFWIALVAASIKASSVVLAPVSWVFVQNPVVSILLEGGVIWLLAGVVGFGTRSRWVPVQAFTAAAGWRVMFVLAHLVLGLQWGLMQRGVGAVVQFVVIDSIINTVLITALIYAGTPGKLTTRTVNWLRPVPIGLIVIGAVAAEHAFSLL